MLNVDIVVVSCACGFFPLDEAMHRSSASAWKAAADHVSLNPTLCKPAMSRDVVPAHLAPEARAMSNLTAQTVSRLLRDAGARPTPRGQVGYTVTGSSSRDARRSGRVTVSADWDLDSTSVRRAVEAAELLREHGLTVEQAADSPIIYVTREH